MDIGDIVHYICTETELCQAAIITDLGPNPAAKDPTVTLNVQRPHTKFDHAAVERRQEIPYRVPGAKVPGTWHRREDLGH